jgi:hypothetical protein
VTEWQLQHVPAFEWAAEPPDRGLEEWIASDGGFWIYPPAGTDREPVWMPGGDVSPVMAALSAILDVAPGIGTLKDVVQLFTGEDLITGEKLSWFQRILGLAGPLETYLKGVENGAKILNAARSVATVADRVDLFLDLASLAGSSADMASWGIHLANAAVQLRDGADVESLEWRDETTALLHAGQLEAQRLTEQIAARHPLTPEQASQVREILLKTFVRQAQADGLLPKRLEVVPSAAEGGDPTESVDVRDPMTGTTWDVSDSLGVVTSPPS